MKEIVKRIILALLPILTDAIKELLEQWLRDEEKKNGSRPTA